MMVLLSRVSPVEAVYDARLTLHTLHQDDFSAFHALYANPRVYQPAGFSPWDGEAAIRQYFEKWLALPADRPDRAYALRLEGQGALCGTINLHDWDAEANNLTIGYSLAPHLWGKGLMGACLSWVLPWVFDGGLGVTPNRIQAWVMVGNPRSGRLLERLGFCREGTLRSLVRRSGQYHDVHCYGLLAGELNRSNAG